MWIISQGRSVSTDALNQFSKLANIGEDATNENVDDFENHKRKPLLPDPTLSPPPQTLSSTSSKVHPPPQSHEYEHSDRALSDRAWLIHTLLTEITDSSLHVQCYRAVCEKPFACNHVVQFFGPCAERRCKNLSQPHTNFPALVHDKDFFSLSHLPSSLSIFFVGRMLTCVLLARWCDRTPPALPKEYPHGYSCTISGSVSA